MIDLNVGRYCETCPEFTPDVTNPEPLYDFSQSTEPYMYVGDTVIRCGNRKRCTSILNHLKKELENESKATCSEDQG